MISIISSFKARYSFIWLIVSQVALVQIAAAVPAPDGNGVQHKVLLLHNLGLFPALKLFIEDPAIVMAGRAVSGDVSKLARDYNPAMKTKKCEVSTLELGSLCRLAGLVKSGRAGLAELCAAVLHQRLPKPQDLRIGQWDQPLSDEQKKYAANDALVSMQIAHEALRRPLASTRLTAATAVAGVEVDIVISKRKVATGRICDNAVKWHGQGRSQYRVCVELDTLYVPAQFLPYSPEGKAIPAWWETTLDGKAKRLTYSRYRELCMQNNVRPIIVMTGIRSLRPHVDF